MIKLLFFFFCVSQELFFGLSAEDSAVNQEAQRYIEQTMALLCPPEGSKGTSVRHFQL